MDQDDSMLSTPSSHGNEDTLDEDSLFPNETANTTTNTSYIPAQTPQNDHLNAAAPGELSPPRSQSIPNTNTQANGSGHGASITVDEDLTSEDEGVDVKADGARSGIQEEKTKPGAGWKNKKAQEEIAKAWESIVDKDFDIKAYGDPLAGRQK